MEAAPFTISEVLLIEPEVFGYERGFFCEVFDRTGFEKAIGNFVQFVQNNYSCRVKNVLLGLRYEIRKLLDKQVRWMRGAVSDGAVGILKSSPISDRWLGVEFIKGNHRQLWVPPGFSHGFVVLFETADFLYKTTNYCAPDYERRVLWGGAELGVDWHYEDQPLLSSEYSTGAALAHMEFFV